MTGNEIDWRGEGSRRVPTVRDSNEPEVRRANAGLRGVEPEEVQHVLGSSSWSAESLLHNRDNGVTRGVWRVSVDRDEPRHRDGWPLPERAVVKIVSSAPSGNPGSWRPSEKPNHWCYWRREPEIYQSDVPLLGDEVGLTLPNLLDVFERENEGAAEISLWLEDVEGLPGEDFSLAQHEEAAEALGRFQALASRRENGSHRPWASRGFLRDYSGFRVCPASTLDNDALWSTELVAETLGEDVRRAARLLLAERDSLLSVVEGLPTTLCHLDFWPKNLMRRESGESVVALDWAFAGYGAFGEDLGNYVPDCVMDHFVAADDLQALEEATWRGYLRGLQECGWNGDEQIVRLGVYASAVKYSWLLPTMLGQLERGESKKYGGGPADDLVLQLTERGKAIVHLAGWVEKARKLAFP